MKVGETNDFGELLVWKSVDESIGILRIGNTPPYSYDIVGNVLDNRGYPTSMYAGSFKAARKLAYANWRATCLRETAENKALHLRSIGK